MPSDDKNIIDLNSVRKKQKADKQKERIKNFFGASQQKNSKKVNDGSGINPNRMDILRWIQFIGALAVTALLMRSCGFL